MKVLTILALSCCFYAARAQNLAYSFIPDNAPKNEEITQSANRQKTKPASYSTLGYCFPLNEKDIIIGGTTTVYKKFGTFISYKVGVQNFLMPTKGDRGEFSYTNVEKNGWTITGNTEQSTAFTFCGGMAVAVTRRIPLYFGAGVTRYREFFEYIDPVDNKPKWNVNENRTRLELNYTAGIFVPLFSRVILNVSYDHNPQMVFVGLGIRGLYTYEDADEWWWGANKR
jgi:hypothetical protein